MNYDSESALHSSNEQGPVRLIISDMLLREEYVTIREIPKYEVAAADISIWKDTM